MGYIVARIIAVIFLFWALDRHPYDYYTFLRFVVCGVSAYGAFISNEFGKDVWTWIFGIIAILFNPLIPIHLNKGTWAIIDIIVAIIFLISFHFIKKPKAQEE